MDMYNMDILSRGQISVFVSHHENEWCMIGCESIMVEKSLMYMEKSIRPSRSKEENRPKGHRTRSLA